MMPGTADAVPNHKALRERRMVMTALRIDGEYFRAGAHQQNFPIADMAEQGLAGEVLSCDALREIRSGG